MITGNIIGFLLKMRYDEEENYENILKTMSFRTNASMKDFKATLFIETLNIKSIDRDYKVKNKELNLENNDEKA